MNKKRLFHFGQVVIISLALLFAPTISYNVDAATQQIICEIMDGLPTM